MTLIKSLFSDGQELINKEVSLFGWARSVRRSKNVAFLALNDGSTQGTIQVVCDENLANFEEVSGKLAGTCFSVDGVVVKSMGKGQSIEIQAKKVVVEGDVSSEGYPLQKKATSLEFLREIPHLRARTNTFGAVFRLRHSISFATHQFFHQENFYYMNTPIVTASDCEGAGELFRVTTLDLDKLADGEKKKVDYNFDFYKKPAYLTVSGQLNAEAMAMGLGRVYTFGPTFRAENSHTSRHLSEFWMVEPEAAGFDLNDNMDLAENYLKYLINFILKENPEELAFLAQHYQKDLVESLEKVRSSNFVRLTYTEAISILEEAMKNKKVKFEYKVAYGTDLQSEHERYLTDVHFKGPVFVTDYPKSFKAFYMKLNDDNETVRAMDLLIPGIGELIGGSQREDNEEKLLARMKDAHLDPETYDWYLQLRRFGSIKHSGFGMGLERMIMYVTGMSNIRDVIAFPRFPGSAEF